jgi:tetratricopeptide (TPR) repeat protein
MARQPAKAKPAPEAPAKPKRPPITLPVAAAWTSDVRTLAVNITILLAIILVVPVIATQFLRSQVVIEPITVPEPMRATGLTPEVAAGRLWDGLESISASAGTAKATVVSIPESAKVDFAIPDSGLSIDALVYYVRQFFHAYETRVSGEFRCADPACTPDGMTLRIRVIADEVNLIDLPARGSKTEEAYFRDAAAEVMSYLDPFTALAAVSTTDPARGKVLARRLIRTNHPDAKWAYNLLGNLLVKDSDFEGAEEQFRAALAIDPDFPQSLSNLGDLLVKRGDLAGARTAFDRVLAKHKDDVFALRGKADLALVEGKVDESVAYLMQAAAIRPLPPMFINLAGNVMYGQGRTDEAISYYKQALDVDPGDQLALAMLGLIYVNAERYDDAERVYRAAADFAPDNAEILSTHSAMLRSAHKFDEALERAQRAIALDASNADYHQAAGLALQDLARYDEALVELAEADRLGPDDLTTVMAIADVYRLKGENAKAAEAYNRYLAVAPEDEVMRGVAELYLGMVGGTPATAPEPASASSTQP